MPNGIWNEQSGIAIGDGESITIHTIVGHPLSFFSSSMDLDTYIHTYEYLWLLRLLILLITGKMFKEVFWGE